MSCGFPLQVVLSAVAVAVAAMTSGCTSNARIQRAVEQPFAFSHTTHVNYFVSGTHRAENIKLLHLDPMGLAETDALAEPIVQGRCVECHTTFEELKRQDCGTCHRLFQDENTRKNRAERPCLGCHNKAWTNFEATIPTITNCKTCHFDKPITTTDQEKTLMEYIKKGEDIPWVEVRYVDRLLVSHVAHVRFGALQCTSCHVLATGEPSTPLLPEMLMDDCVTCHEQENADTKCLACHK